MTDYTKLVKALRYCAETPEEEKDCNLCEYYPKCSDVIAKDAAAAIEALQTELEKKRTADCWGCKCQKLEPKRGEWILCGQVGWPKWKCSVCHSEGRGDYIRCPWCGAVMYESNASNALNALDNAQDGPIITPCRGCSDYDGYGGCKSKGGCARAKMEVQE